MSSRTDESRRNTGPVVVAVAILSILCLPVLYVLSLGPAVWLVNHQCLSVELAQWFYWPLEMAVERFDWLQTALGWYVELFE